MQTLSRIYKEYGGLKAFIISPYLWASFLISILLLWSNNPVSEWLEIPLRVSPPLVGFTVASFGLIFAVTSEDSRLILSQPDDGLGGRKPLLVIVSKIVHSVFIQLFALVMVIAMLVRPIPYHEYYSDFIAPLNDFFFWLTSFLFVYGIFLVFSVAMALFTLVQIIADSLDAGD